MTSKKASKKKTAKKTPKYKVCCTCGEKKAVKTKDGTNFWKNASSPDGLRAQCKLCFYTWRKKKAKTERKEAQHEA